ncbi:hypothetical protein [Methylocystis sp. H4A]|uniref:hypothetical protein n=1 Tax=Methylocystis sp. H4A TaxID=2785788 RepID=UPI001FEF257B|nr:hypothetical protein [Methylocystis sp. H4A]
MIDVTSQFRDLDDTHAMTRAEAAIVRDEDIALRGQRRSKMHRVYQSQAEIGAEARRSNERFKVHGPNVEGPLLKEQAIVTVFEHLTLSSEGAVEAFRNADFTGDKARVLFDEGIPEAGDFRIKRRVRFDKIDNRI